MDFSEEWKSLWPISSVFSPPLLLSDRATAGKTTGGDSGSSPPRKIGPLFFHPSPETLTPIFTSPSLYTPTPSPFPSLSISRFLQTTTNSILPSNSSAIASRFGPQISDTQLVCNSLQLLRCHGSSSVFVFFPTGENSDQVGFILLTVKNGIFGFKDFSASSVLNHRILKLLLNRVTDSYYSVDSFGDSCFSTVGYLMICTMYSVYWYSAQVKGLGSDSESPKLVFLGSKVFRSSAVVDACWSPHLEKECVVLLESGELFLFDLDSYYRKSQSSSINFKGKNLPVLWDDLDIPKKGSWLSCQFSWHPRILVVGHSGMAFLVDLRSEGCKVNCLLRTNMLSNGNSVETDRFVAFSRAGSDGFHFTAASNNLLILFDVRKPLMPVLQWVHGIDNPTYLTVIKLSELRSNSKNDEYKWATETGSCILLGSFWNCEFSLFCYGPHTSTSVASEISRFSKSSYAWELPSELSLSARDCSCGSCLLREEYSKDALPKWIVWQQKKEIVLGFCILDKDLSGELFEPEIFGGFTVIRLMSSGKLELQRYFASPQPMNFSDKAHGSSLLYNKSFIYTNGDEKYRFPRKFQYLKLDYLYGYLNDSLGKVLNKKKSKAPDKAPEVSSNSDFHINVCKKLMACGITRFRSSPAISYVIRDIVSPMSVQEIAVMSTWSSLPAVLLRLGFVTYAELFGILANKKNLPLEFLDVPDQPHLPPFSSRSPSHRSNKWSHKLQHSNGHVGPAAPLPFLVTYSKLYIEEEADELSANEQLELQCSEVIEMVNKVVPDANDSEPVVSLANDKDDMCDVFEDPDQYSLYKPVALSDKNCFVDPTSGSSTNENQNYSTFVHRSSQKEVFSNNKMGFLKPETIGAICPTGLKFHNRPIDYLPTEFKYFIGQQKKFQESFNANRSTFLKKDL